MNDAHLHLLINHLPIVGLIIGTLILIAGLLFRSTAVRVVALFVIIFAAGFAIPAFSSGEGAEEVVEHMSGMTKETHHMIHEHEEKAEFFMIFVWSLLCLSILTLLLIWKKNKAAMYLEFLVLALALVGTYVGREVGSTGGEITHLEIRKDFVESDDHHHDDDHDDHD